MKKNFFILLLIFMLTIITYFAESSEKVIVALFNFENVGMIENDYYVTMRFLREEIANIEKFDLIERATLVRAVGETAVFTVDKALKKSEKLKADKCIIGSFLKLGNKIIIRFKLVDVKRKSIEFEDEVTSESIEDLNNVIKRVAKGIETKQIFIKTATTEMITKEETEEVRKRESFSCYGIKIGYLYPVGSSYGKKKELTHFQFSWQYEIPSLIIESVFGFSASSRASESTFDLSFLYPLKKTDISPYFGGGIGIHSIMIQEKYYDDYGYYSYDYNSKSGFTLNFGTGLILFRTYNFRVIFDLRAYHTFAEVGDQNGHTGVAFTFALYKKKKPKYDLF